MNCTSVERYLDALMDGELDASARVEVDKHLAVCPSCGDRLAFAETLRHQLRATVAQGRAPEALRARVTQALREESSPSWWRADLSWRATAAAAAVALVVFGVGGSIDSRAAVMQAGVAPILDDVMRAHDRGVPAEVKSSEQIPAYFENKVGFRVQPVQFADPAVRFVGARDAQVGGRHAATLQYEVHGRRMTVVAFRPPAYSERLGELVDTGGGRLVRAVRVRGHVVPLVEHDGIVYAVVSDLDADDRLELAARASLH